LVQYGISAKNKALLGAGFESLSLNRDDNFKNRNSRVRYLPHQPASPGFGQAPRDTRERAGNPGFSRIPFRLQTPNSPNRAREPPKVSGRFPENSRFGETKAGDFGSNSHWMPKSAVNC
jgi:hypothetical protein